MAQLAVNIGNFSGTMIGIVMGTALIRGNNHNYRIYMYIKSSYRQTASGSWIHTGSGIHHMYGNFYTLDHTSGILGLPGHPWYRIFGHQYGNLCCSPTHHTSGNDLNSISPTHIIPRTWSDCRSCYQQLCIH